MSPAASKRLKALRIAAQASFFALFLTVYVRSLDPFAVPQNPFLRFDPLIFLTNPQGSLGVLLGVGTLAALTLLLGRFFCGWVCPLGALIAGLDALLSPLRRRNPRALRSWAGRRILVRYQAPALALLGVAAVTAFTPAPVLQFLHPNVWIIRIVSLSALGLAFLGFLVLLSLFARRLWCTYLCPLGALYGLLARLSVFRLRIAACSACGRCGRCPMEAASHERREVLRHQCVLCFDFEHACAAEGFRYDARREAAPTDVGRRRFFRHSAQLAAGVALGGLLGTFRRRHATGLLRPPGVVDEGQFVEHCLRCLQCVRSCPNQIIKITDQSHGFASLFTPHLEFRPYGCDYYCQVCQQVCPNRAIPLQTLERKQRTPVGLARIDQKLCVVYTEGFNCLVCEEVCPVPDKAIRYVVVDNPKNPGEALRRPKMVDSRCIGCGVCEARCPAEPVAIRVFPPPRA